jgi:hypothetical protein
MRIQDAFWAFVVCIGWALLLGYSAIKMRREEEPKRRIDRLIREKRRGR